MQSLCNHFNRVMIRFLLVSFLFLSGCWDNSLQKSPSANASSFATSSKDTFTEVGTLSVGAEVLNAMQVALVSEASLTEDQAKIVVASAKARMNTAAGVLVINTNLVKAAKAPIAVVSPAIIQGAIESLNEINLSSASDRANVAKIVMKSTFTSLDGRTSSLSSEETITLAKTMAESAVSSFHEAGLDGKNSAVGAEAISSGSVAALKAAGYDSDTTVDAAKAIITGTVGSLPNSESDQEFLSTAVNQATYGGVSVINEVADASDGGITAVSALTGAGVSGLKNLNLKENQVSSLVGQVTAGSVAALGKAKLTDSNLGEALKAITGASVQAVSSSGFSDAAVKESAGAVAGGAVSALSLAGVSSASIGSSDAVSQIMSGTMSSLTTSGISGQAIAETMGSIVGQTVASLGQAGIDSTSAKKDVMNNVIAGVVANFTSSGIKDIATINIAMQSLSKGAASSLANAGIPAKEINSVASFITQTSITKVTTIGVSGASELKNIIGNITQGMMQGMSELASNKTIATSDFQASVSSVTSGALSAVKVLQTQNQVSGSDIGELSTTIAGSAINGLAFAGVAPKDLSNFQNKMISSMSSSLTDLGVSGSTLTTLTSSITSAASASIATASTIASGNAPSCANYADTLSESAFLSATESSTMIICAPTSSAVCPKPRTIAITDYTWIIQNGTSATFCQLQKTPHKTIVTVPVLTVPGAPTIGVVTAGNASASVAFTAPSSNGGATIIRYTAKSIPGGIIGTASTSPIVVSGLTNGITYTFVVVATNSIGTGAASSASASITPMAKVPAAPIIGTATPGNSNALVSFTAPTFDGGLSITSYTATSIPGNFIGVGTSSPIVVAGLTNGISYTFKVTATNSAGTGPASGLSNAVVPTGSVPSPPTITGTSSIGTLFTAGALRLDPSGPATNTSELDPTWTPYWPSLIGYWKLNEPTGASIAADSAYGSFPLTVNGPLFGATGKLRNASYFDGASSLTLPSAASTVIDNWTLMAWINPSTLPLGAGFPGFVVYNGTDAGGYGFGIGESNGTSGSKLVGLFGGSSWLDSGYTFPEANLWYHVAMVRYNQITSFYVNGTQTPNTFSSGIYPLPVQAAFSIGKEVSSPGNSYFQGLIDEVAFWHTPLNPADIKTIYARQSPVYSGQLTSTVIDHGSNANWSGLSWTTTVPFGKELQANSENSANYSAQTPNLMNGIAGLWHLNEGGPGTVGAADFADVSGNNNHGYAINGVTFGANGKFSKSVALGNSSYINVPTSPSLAITDDITISTWIKLKNLNTYHSIIGKTVNNMPAPYDYYVASGSGIAQFLHGGNGGAQSAAASLGLRPGVWSHLAVTLSGGLITHYLNGVPNGTGVVNNPGIDQGTDLLIGDRSDHSVPLNGEIDEVAIWNRALSAAEILELYRRGANQIKFQVRSCNLSDCSDGHPWLGPDGTNLSYFSEAQNTGPLFPSLVFANFGGFVSNFLSPAQYFQYRVILESDDTSTSCNGSWCSPELQNVTIAP